MTTDPMPREAAIRLELSLTSTINFALQQNKLPILQKLVIRNDTEEDLRELTLRFFSEPELLLPLTCQVELIPAGSAFSVEGVRLSAKGDVLAELTERITGLLHLQLLQGGTVLAQCSKEITALAFDEWHGSAFYPELLTAFVTPNHPVIAQIAAQVAELLGKWTNDPSLNAYQTQNPNRVRQQMAAVYGVLQSREIVYALPPASFESIGQRVRLCDAVLEQKLGTCLDLTLLYASCLEAIGLHPLLLLQEGHIFAGAWLENRTFAEAVQDDPSVITKRLTDGIGEIAAVECTALTAGKGMGFDEACAAAARNLTGADSLQYIIDVSRARLSGIRPLPQRIRENGGWRIQNTELHENEKEIAAPADMVRPVPVKEGGVRPADRLAQWERRLLDLGLRNTLINLRFGKSVIPILTPSLDQLEDALSSGSEYGISCRPAEWTPPGDGMDIESVVSTGGCADLIQSEFRNNRLRSVLGEADLNRAVVNLYRSAKTSLEENGANTLYLSLGLLRWYETKASQKPRYAPIVLLPVEIVRKSANKGYVIRLRDEEPQMNITLLEMLKQNFGISVSGLDPLPQDEHGVDTRAVFTVLCRAVMDQSRWDVIETAVLGIFSFSQFVMWNDIRSRPEELRKNAIVRSLMDGRLCWEPEPMEIGDQVDEDGVLLPIPADASQLYAIRAAAEGRSFVLHGPPGTGKSQTITALIVNALAQGKTVLFVAEKMAALSVVQRRLEEIGIGPFCLELHSNKSKKRDVLEQLRAATEITRTVSPGEYDRKARQAAEMRRKLDAYGQALHRKQPSGLSLFEMISGYEQSLEGQGLLRFPADTASAVDPSLLERQKEAVGQLIAAAKAVGHPCGHPLSAVRCTGFSRQLRDRLPEELNRFRTSLHRLQQAGNAFSAALELPPARGLRTWKKYRSLAGELVIWLAMPRSWAREEQLSAAVREIRELAVHIRKAGSLRKELSAGWQDSLLGLSGQQLQQQWNEAQGQWLLPRLTGQSRVLKLLRPHSKAPLQKKQVPAVLAALTAFQTEQTAADALLARREEGLEQLYRGAETDWETISRMAEEARQSAFRLRELTDGDDFRRAAAARRELAPVVEEMDAAFRQAMEAQSALYGLLDIAGPERLQEDWVDAQLTLCSSIQSGADQLQEWTVWNTVRREAASAGLMPVVQAYLAGLPHDKVLPAYENGLYAALAQETIDREPVLSAFSGTVFSERIRQFRECDAALTGLARTEAFCRLAARVPSFAREAAHSSEVGILQRAIRSGGRGISIRRLLEQIPNLLPRLCPCMLMSPISATQYLSAGRELFDIVVFDEASQMPTCKAVGALARGKSAVIVGDPNQMPPTSFFSGSTADEENPESEDLESILDDCLALSMPQTHLLWHYRSRHESLIAFSNNRFYENRLYTFPSAADRESRVSLVQVDGFFDRGRTRQNRAEAEAVVRELQRRCRDSRLRGQSVGVVTFNLPQQNLIDDLLTEVCRTDPALEAWAYEREDPLFIKNLENVQGDERDVILFSVGYGPDVDGKVFMNFGPLNQEGGWRRLNVAVTRARQEMMVFSTLQPEQIDLSRTSARGVAALRAFLEYARGGRLETAASIGTASPDSCIAAEICRRLAALGYESQTMVGRSAYRIDIGVLNPDDPGRYLLGVLLDGSSYAQARTTRDREIAQIAVLQGLGWEIHRIWTMDWWNNCEKEMQALLTHIESRRAALPAAPPETSPEAPAKIPDEQLHDNSKSAAAPPDPVSAASAYQAAALPETPMDTDTWLLPQTAPLIMKAVEAVLKAEAPICEGLLFRRVLQSFGIGRAGARIQGRMAQLLQRMDIPFTCEGGQKTYWAKGQAPEAYEGFRTAGSGDSRREARDLPPRETANAVCALLKEQIGLPREDLIRETARLLGYARSGSLVTAAIASGIDFALQQGRICQQQDGYLTLK
ncbi:MAG: DUF3320 domain-containing protein [Oscillospiraceae bacterium]|nr:DUF3320 domain-containing protein [Oscillospiraceae bacterium]